MFIVLYFTYYCVAIGELIKIFKQISITFWHATV